MKTKKIIIIILLLILGGGSFFYYFQNKKSAFNCGGNIQDYERNSYQTIKIGDQCWMKDNLRSTKDAQGKNIERLCYEENNENCEKYGGLYTYRTAFNRNSNFPIQGICPEGWRIPATEDFQKILNASANFQDCDISSQEKDTLCENINLNKFGIQFGGLCVHSCDYQSCKLDCSQLNSAGRFISYIQNPESSIPNLRSVIISKGKIEVKEEYYGTPSSLICVKD